MKQQFFCSEVSNQVGEDLIGSATPCQTYVLVECPPPWKSDAFESKGIPANLRSLVDSVKQARSPIRFLLIHRKQDTSLSSDAVQAGDSVQPDNRTHVLIYQQSADKFCPGYQRWEWQVDCIEAVAPLVQSYLTGQSVIDGACCSQRRDLLVCVHGSHDKCCAKYGFPFYRAAIDTLEQIGNHQVRLWQTSHFGGHRFAPTLIDLPSGRYYGRLDQGALRSILTHSGDLRCFSDNYRGWGILPNWLQPVEKELIQCYGWQWLDNRIAYQILRQSINQTWIQVRLVVVRPNGSMDAYDAEVVKDCKRTVCLRTSCGSSQESELIKYRVESLSRKHSQSMRSSLLVDAKASI
jgi:hypothetical protein